MLGNAKAVRRSRQVPICPRLHALLLEAYSEAPDGQVTVAGRKARNVAEATYASWLGHSPAVSRNSYVAPLDSEYEAITEISG